MNKKWKAPLPERRHEAGERPYIIVDGMNIAYTCLYAYKLSVNGKSVGCLYGFMKMLNSIITRNGWNPEKIIVVWDGKKSKRRLKWLPEYKGHRNLNMDSRERKRFIKQVDKTRRFLHYMGICQVWNQKIEGDDMIYWVAKKYQKLSRVIIISGDKDMLQLVNRDVHVFNQRGGGIFTPELIPAGNYGIFHNQLVDFFCIVGDKSDDIPGIKGIGEVRAHNFLDKFGSVENYLNNKKAEFTGMVDKSRVKKIYRRNKKLIDLKWYNEKYHTEKCIKFYRNKINPEFNEEKFEQFITKYRFKTYRDPKLLKWLKSF